MSTVAGGMLIFIIPKLNSRFLAGALGFSAGVMLYISMVEILSKAGDMLAEDAGARNGACITAASFFAGILFIMLVQKLSSLWFKVPEGDSKELMQTGVIAAFAIALHNFPEGLATFVSAMQEPEMAIPVVFALAVHNIPEGVIIGIPVYKATGSKIKALLYTFISALAEPLGALIGWTVMMPVMSPLIFAIIFAAAAGIMVYISLSELIPDSFAHGYKNTTAWGIFFGMAVMAVSILMFM